MRVDGIEKSTSTIKEEHRSKDRNVWQMLMMLMMISDEMWMLIWNIYWYHNCDTDIDDDSDE